MSSPFVLLVNPWIYDFAAYDLWVKPLGLLYIAAVLRQDGFGVHLIDCLDANHPEMASLCATKKTIRKETGQGHFYREEITKPDALKFFNKKYKRYGIIHSLFDNELTSLPRPQAVFVTSMMTYWYHGVFEIIKNVKAVWPEVPVVLGGIYATICYGHAQKFSGADIIVRGAGESEALRILEQQAHKTITHIPKTAEHVNPPCPAFELLSSKKSLPVITARGCPFKCTYCASSVLNPYFTVRDSIEVTDEIEYWVQKEGTTDFAFYDDALLFDAEAHAIPLFNEIIKRKLPVRFHSPNGLHIKYINQRVADLMKEAGFKTIRLGLETSDRDMQQATGGKVTTEDFIRAANALKKAGFSSKEAGVYILAGLPGQEAREVYDTIQLVKNQGLKPIIAEYSPIPGTALWDKAVASSPFPIADEPLFHNNSLLPCQWEKFTVDDLNKLKIQARNV